MTVVVAPPSTGAVYTVRSAIAAVEVFTPVAGLPNTGCVELAVVPRSRWMAIDLAPVREFGTTPLLSVADF